MSTACERVFYPNLERQDSYPTKPDGSFYAYSYYRKHVADDCKDRCVYCDAYADDVGGAEAMQLDHFKPESIAEFANLVNNPRNLHYACGRCNLLKSNHWPACDAEATHNGREGFIDPFTEDRLNYFNIESDGVIRALQPPASYMIGLLRLDREFLKKLREHRQLRVLWRNRVGAIRYRLEQGEAVNQVDIIQTLTAIEILLG